MITRDVGHSQKRFNVVLNIRYTLLCCNIFTRTFIPSSWLVKWVKGVTSKTVSFINGCTTCIVSIFGSGRFEFFSYHSRSFLETVSEYLSHNQLLLLGLPFLSHKFGSTRRFVVSVYSFDFEENFVPSFCSLFPIDFVFFVRSIKSATFFTCLFWRLLFQCLSQLSILSSFGYFSGSSTGLSSHSSSRSWFASCSSWGMAFLPFSASGRPLAFILDLGRA